MEGIALGSSNVDIAGINCWENTTSETGSTHMTEKMTEEHSLGRL
jgi:hypothetical protein